MNNHGWSEVCVVYVCVVLVLCYGIYMYKNQHCVKSVHIRSFSVPIFPHLDWIGRLLCKSLYLVQMRGNRDQKIFFCLTAITMNLRKKCSEKQQPFQMYQRSSRTAATSKMEVFVIIVNGFQPLTIITKCSILDVAAVLDPPLCIVYKEMNWVDLKY